MFLQDVRKDLQGKALLLPGLLTPLVRVHFCVWKIRIIVFVLCKRNNHIFDNGWGHTSCKQPVCGCNVTPRQCQFRQQTVPYQQKKTKKYLKVMGMHFLKKKNFYLKTGIAIIVLFFNLNVFFCVFLIRKKMFLLLIAKGLMFFGMSFITKLLTTTT